MNIFSPTYELNFEILEKVSFRTSVCPNMSNHILLKLGEVLFSFMYPKGEQKAGEACRFASNT